MEQQGVRGDAVTYTTFLNYFVKIGDTENAQKVLERMEVRDY